MLTPEEKTALRGRFTSWLAGTDGGAFECGADGYHITLIRVRKNGDFDYLYCQRQYRGGGIERRDKFEYAGIYCKRDGLVYDNQYDIRLLSEDYSRSPNNLREDLKRAVRQAVEDAVGNDRGNLRVTELTTERKLEEMAYFQKYTAPGEARAAYLSGGYCEGCYLFTFRCCYDPENWTEDSLLAYILEPAKYAAAESAAYINGHQEHILSDFLQADMVAAEYAALLKNPLNPVHRVKRIMEAVNASSAKTVYVTICKDDIDMIFKAEAAQFRRDCVSHYSDWNIVAADRREFSKRYGSHSHYGPEDILRIEYARRVLYQAVEVRA